MNQLTAIVDGKRCTMLTSNSIEEAERSCRDRVGERFQGFAPIPTATKARAKWAEYRAKAISRDDLEAWLEEQGGDEQEIRAMFNEMRGA
ncbi:hypothetical protein [Marinobacter sp. CA1]|uniref:hypothetical protein n=1 Tax=Marinobacter sp. CA1 TaxID=2817656 RepID=UPI001D08D906|nr:hypothetical protein [Marinobacter sp. CA1]UDL03994.1 hypothetical protein J2887_14895 [Marinobacter sp. CA1]